MNYNLFRLILLILFLSSCTEKSNVNFSNKPVITGSIFLVAEFIKFANKENY